MSTGYSSRLPYLTLPRCEAGLLRRGSQFTRPHNRECLSRASTLRLRQPALVRPPLPAESVYRARVSDEFLFYIRLLPPFDKRLTMARVAERDV